MFKLGIISDEVSSDFEQSCALISRWGLKHVELRTLWGKNIMQLSDEELVRANRTLREHALEVTGVASPIFKSPLDGKPKELEADFALGGAESFEEQLALLERAADLCERFETSLIRVFTFWREPWTTELATTVGTKLAAAAQVARNRGVVLAIENEPVCTVGTGEELGMLWEYLSGHVQADLLRHLTMLWDPGNALAAGENAYPDGYQALPIDEIGHVHLKDVRPGDDGKPEFLPVGWGNVDYDGQVKALARDGYDGVLVLEPHYRPVGVPLEDAAHTAVTEAQKLLERVERETGAG